MTLREVWESKGLSPTQVAARSGITTTTLYKMNRKDTVASRTIASVCKTLEITREQYNNLEPDR